MRIRVQKIGEVKTGLPANPKAAHIDGQVQNENFSIPIEYTVEGELIGPLKVGNPMKMWRDTRNGVKVLGLFNTSILTEITKKQFKTLNSVYNYEYLENPANN